MTLRIIDSGDGRHIRVDGRLTHEEVAELDLAIGATLGRVSLELQDLRSADRAGLAALRRLRDEGATLLNLAPHLAWRLDDDDV